MLEVKTMENEILFSKDEMTKIKSKAFKIGFIVGFLFAAVPCVCAFVIL